MTWSWRVDLQLPFAFVHAHELVHVELPLSLKALPAADLLAVAEFSVLINAHGELCLVVQIFELLEEEAVAAVVDHA